MPFPSATPAAPTLILLAPPEEQDDATAILRAADASVIVVPVGTVAALARAVEDHPNARLVSVASPVIVPDALLDALPGPAYNLHPGPPAYPGLFPAVFALYEGATRFGTTLHEMAAEVDTGPIVAANETPLPDDIDRAGLEALSRHLARHLLAGMAPALVDVSRPLPPVGVPWGGPARRRTDFDALCRLPNDVDDAEFRRRLRAVGEGPNHAVRLFRFGRWFRLEPEDPCAPVVKGGRVMAP